MSGSIRILVVDDHPVVRRGIIACLIRADGVHVVGEAGDGLEALQKARQLSPNLVVMDIDMPRMDGLTAAEILRKEMRQLKILILTMHAHPEYVIRIVSAGAHGYLLKDSGPEQLIEAIRIVRSDGTFFSPEVARVALNGLLNPMVKPESDPQLTPREVEVLIQIGEGYTNKEIAMRLAVGVRTVETHRERIMRKLNLHTIAALTKYAVGRGLIRVERGEPALAAGNPMNRN